MARDLDMQIRLAAFAHLDELVQVNGEVLPARALRDGFLFEGRRIRLKGIQGIFKPEGLPQWPLSITTAPPDPSRPAPYDDGFTQDGSTLLYRYRGTDPHHWENVALRGLIKERRPLIYFHGVVKGAYFAAWPVYVVHDEPARLRFRVEIDDVRFASAGLAEEVQLEEQVRRRYVTVTARRRLHQSAFRVRVLRAYREACSLCRLKRESLLDAAHILPDTDPLGEPTVSNGLALCKLHHAAFDQHLIGVRPDLTVQVRQEILDEEDGPMLTHGLQGVHNRRIVVPKAPEQRPRGDYVEERYRRFLLASGG